MGRLAAPCIGSWGPLARSRMPTASFVSISLVYLYILPLAVGAIFLRKKRSATALSSFVSCSMTITPRGISIRDFGSSTISPRCCGFAFLVYVIQRYMEQREALARLCSGSVMTFLKDMELAVQVQRLFLPGANSVMPDSRWPV